MNNEKTPKKKKKTCIHGFKNRTELVSLIGSTGN